MGKYKITVLSDLGGATRQILKSTISLAKMIDAEIALFTVKKPTDIVAKENQLSAMRTINREHTQTDRKIQGLLAPLYNEYGVAISHSFAFGNVKNEIEQHIKKNRPDIIVMGKKKTKSFNLLGNGITQFVLNTFMGVIMIADDKKVLEPNTDISLGLLNSSKPSSDLAFAKDLMEHTRKPLKSFKVVTKSVQAEETPMSKADAVDERKTIEYVFEHNDNTVKNLSNYLLKSNIDLLFLERGKRRPDNQSSYVIPEMKDIISNLDVPLLVTGEKI